MFTVKNLADCPEWIETAAEWFHDKWSVPASAYLESMQMSLRQTHAVPQWYIVTDKSRIIAGLGVIENDFHDRKDLAPNVCAVFVEPDYRCQGIAGQMLRFVCADMAARGIATLYLITSHTSFYERYGWEFHCMVQGDGEAEMTRLYKHTEPRL